MVKYKPLVVNAHQLTKESLKMDPNSPLYVHIDWVKPGRHTFVIKHDADGPDGMPEEETSASASAITINESQESSNLAKIL